jgi:arylformamidase
VSETSALEGRPVFDISRPVVAGIPVWPGDTPYEYRRTWKIGPGCPVNVGAVTMSLHTGAHTDAPFHFDDAGADVASVALSKYVGACVVVRIDGGTGGVRPEDLPPGTEAALRAAPRLLLRTYERRPAGFDVHLRHLTPALADWLADRGVVLVGLDSDSMDAFDSKELPSHRRLAARGVAILEGIDLSAVAPGVYDLVALPLRLVGADASPVRAVLIGKASRR